MGAGYLEWDIGVAVFSEYNKDSFPTVQINAYGEQQSGVPPYEQHSPHGMISRPHDPETDGAGTPIIGCTVLYALDGGQGHAWVQSDPRIIPLLPQIEKGGYCSYGGLLKNPSFHNVDGLTGSQTIYVPYKIENDVASKCMTIEINVDTDGEESISIIHGSGAALTIVEDSGSVSSILKNAAGDAYLEVNDQGVVINGPLTLNGSLNAGGPVGALPLAMAIPTVTALAALQAQLVALNAWFVAMTSTAWVPATMVANAPIAATAVAAMTAGAVILATSAPLIPAKNTSGM